MLHLFVLVLLALSMPASSAPSRPSKGFTNVRHVGLNDTHLVVLDEDHYAIVNPCKRSLFTVICINDFVVELREPGESFSGLQRIDSLDQYTILHIEDMKNYLERYINQTLELGPNDRFIAVDYPADKTEGKILASKNYNLTELGDKDFNVVYYDPNQFSATRLNKATTRCLRLFLVADYLICVDLNTSTPELTVRDVVDMEYTRIVERKDAYFSDYYFLMDKVTDNALHFRTSKPKTWLLDATSTLKNIHTTLSKLFS